jgi:hypothetical protein
MTNIDKLELLQSTAHNKDFVLMSCGPSINEISEEKIIDFCCDKIVCCVKQSILKFKDICDIHFYNDCNLIPYEYSNHKNTFTCASGHPDTFRKATKELNEINIRNFGGTLATMRKPDIFFNVEVYTGMKNTTASLNNFEDIELEKGLKNCRPCGPGIMHETVFPLLTFLRPKKIYTLGWDLAPRNTGSKTLEHFYPSDYRKTFVNPGHPTFEDEMPYLLDSSKLLNNYLKSKGIELIVLSKQSYVSKEIKRLQI